MTQRLSAPWLRRPLLLRLGAVALLVAVLYATDWGVLRQLFGRQVVTTLAQWGHQTLELQQDGAVLLRVDGKNFSITPACTGVDLFLLIAPFCWRPRRPTWVNVMAGIALAAGLFGANLVRVTLALHFHVAGVPWLVSHDIPYFACFWGCLTIAVLAAVRSDHAACVADRPVKDLDEPYPHVPLTFQKSCG
jgi:hypothetical protein